MRQLILAMQISVDGYIEGPDGDMSWAAKDEEELWDDLFKMLETVDTLILGRKMFSDYRNYWNWCLNNPDASLNERRYAEYAMKNRHIVYSNTMKDPEWSNTTVVAGNVIDHVRELKLEPGGDIHLVGGARLAATLIDAGLVDRYRLVINPYFINTGKSFFQQLTSRQSLELTESKAFKTGHVIVDYVPRRESLI
jgi:dihydrofolate reductase